MQNVIYFYDGKAGFSASLLQSSVSRDYTGIFEYADLLLRNVSNLLLLFSHLADAFIQSELQIRTSN